MAGIVMHSSTILGWIHLIDDLFAESGKYEKAHAILKNETKRIRGLADTRNRLAHHLHFYEGERPSYSNFRPRCLTGGKRLSLHTPDGR